MQNRHCFYLWYTYSMDFAERFRLKTEALIYLKEFKGMIEPVCKRMGLTREDLEDLVGTEELEQRVKDIKENLEQMLMVNAAGGDTKAAEILLAAKFPEEYDSKIRFEKWKESERESGAILPDIVFEVIEKTPDDV